MNKTLYEKQLELESLSFETATKRFLDTKAKDIKNNNFSLNKASILVFKASLESFTNTLNSLLESKSRSKHIVQLKSFINTYYKDRISELAYMIIGNIISNAIRPKLVSLVSKNLTKQLLENISIEHIGERKELELDKIFRKFSKSIRARKKLEYAKRTNKLIELDNNELVRIGTHIVDALVASNIDLITIYKEGTKTMVRLSDSTQLLIFKTEEFFILNNTSRAPLIIPPKDWEGLVGTGGYHSRGNVKFVKAHNKEHFRLLKLHWKPKENKRLLDIVNELQRVPFRINNRIVDVIGHIIKNNIVSPRASPLFPFLIGNIPYQDRLMDSVPMPDSVYTNKELGEVDNYQYAKWARECNLQHRRSMKSTSKALQYKLAYLTAVDYKEYENIYFTYTTDFRYRLYPLQQNLNPQASENIKPMIMFSEGQILTPEGFYWLKIQGANTYGYDKLSFDERVEKIEEMHDSIIEIANDPLGTLMIWDKADEPLQFLSFCFSYKDALEGKPVHTPVYLDGTCSGIQHYSGLLLDKNGAIATNVINNGTGKPSDIYKEVALEAKKVIEEGNFSREYNGSGGDILPTYQTAMEIYKNINRSMTKRNVMTQPYSVTFRGMIKQNDSLLEDYIDANEVWWTGSQLVVSRLLAEINNEAITRVVKGAKVGQKFLKDTIREKCKDKDYVVWYTPELGCPVIQRIKKEVMKRYRSNFGDLVLYDETNETHHLRMANGIAPNYIHSNDSTHLFLTVESGQKRGNKAFMLVHDSFGVPPNNVPYFNIDVRESFIQIYEGRPLANWYRDLTNEELPDEIMIDTLDLNDIRDSTYIFA